MSLSSRFEVDVDFVTVNSGFHSFCRVLSLSLGFWSYWGTLHSAMIWRNMNPGMISKPSMTSCFGSIIIVTITFLFFRCIRNWDIDIFSKVGQEWYFVSRNSRLHEFFCSQASYRFCFSINFSTVKMFNAPKPESFQIIQPVLWCSKDDKLTWSKNREMSLLWIYYQLWHRSY